MPAPAPARAHAWHAPFPSPESSRPVAWREGLALALTVTLSGVPAPAYVGQASRDWSAGAGATSWGANESDAHALSDAS